MLIHDVIEEAIEKKASDIHLTCNIVPVIRVNGELVRLEKYGKLDKDILAEQVKGMLADNDYAKQKYKEDMFVDISTAHKGSRFRVHIFKQRGSDAFVLRLIPMSIPKFSTLNLPPSIRKFTMLKNGLVLITGATGSGKSTTLAAIIDEINETQNKHIITVEDPIEFIHNHKSCVVNQKELGADIRSFSDAVKAAMREDPDILVLGEMRDLETIANAITMAETGHLVFGTLHTKSVAEAVDRMTDVFPPDQQKQVRIQLSNTLQGVVSQSLARTTKGGRVPLCEVMIVNDAIRSLIKENGSPNSINDQLQMNYKTLGTQTIYQAIADLYRKEFITKEVAFSYVEDKELLKKFIMS